MATLTQKQKELLVYIKRTNAQVLSFANKANEDIEFWNSVGVTTPEELEKFWADNWDKQNQTNGDNDELR